MFHSLLIGIGGIIILMVGWIIVQAFWGKTFSDYTSDEDVLAGRTKCSNCGCTPICETKQLSISTVKEHPFTAQQPGGHST